MSTSATHAREREESADRILTKAVKAGRRTYFFDVRATRRGDHFLTITESRKVGMRDGETFYDRRQLFLYKEDFDKFAAGLAEVLDFIRDRNAAAESSGDGAADTPDVAQASDRLFDAIFNSPADDREIPPPL